MQTSGIVKTSGGMFARIGDSIKLEWFSSGIPREEALLRKVKTPRKSPEKWVSLSLAFYNAQLVCTLWMDFFTSSLIFTSVHPQFSLCFIGKLQPRFTEPRSRDFWEQLPQIESTILFKITNGAWPDRRQSGQRGPFRGNFCSSPTRGCEVRRNWSQSAPRRPA